MKSRLPELQLQFAIHLLIFIWLNIFKILLYRFVWLVSNFDKFLNITKKENYIRQIVKKISFGSTSRFINLVRNNYFPL